MSANYVAVDLGAESGRVILGKLNEGSLTLEEIHRFANQPIQDGQALYWDIQALWEGVQKGLIKAAEAEPNIQSVSCDAWGVDYILFDENGALMPPSHHYRDPRCHQGVEETLAGLEWPSIFAESGVQFMPINTIFQLAADDQDRVNRAEKLLLVGDAFNYMLSGVAKAEESAASTSQLYNPRIENWSRKLLGALNLPIKLFAPIVKSGVRLGPLTPALAQETRLNDAVVIAGCSHDTAAAVVAVPAQGPRWAYLSSGTWSLMGVELDKPLINSECRHYNFTNEIGYGGSIRLLKNIVGLWMIQECRREWKEAGADHSYVELSRMAEAAPPFAALVDPADPRFISPGQMPEKVAAYCRETGQEPPAAPGPMVRCILESMALLYRKTLLEIQALTKENIETLHIVGGGCKNDLLNQFTADALGVPVQAGPEEATAMGNILVQAMTLGHVASLETAREISGASCSLKKFQPQDQESWSKAWEQFQNLTANSGRQAAP